MLITFLLTVGQLCVSMETRVNQKEIGYLMVSSNSKLNIVRALVLGIDKRSGKGPGSQYFQLCRS